MLSNYEYFKHLEIKKKKNYFENVRLQSLKLFLGPETDFNISMIFEIVIFEVFEFRGTIHCSGSLLLSFFQLFVQQKKTTKTVTTHEPLQNFN